MDTQDREYLIARRADLVAAQAVLDAEHQRIERESVEAEARLHDLLATQNRLGAALEELPQLSLEWWRAKAELEQRVADLPRLACAVGELMSANAQNHITRRRCADEIAAIDAALGPFTPADADRARAEAN